MPNWTRKLSKDDKVIFRVASLCFTVTKTYAYSFMEEATFTPCKE